jgi:hypothetical protein
LRYPDKNLGFGVSCACARHFVPRLTIAKADIVGFRWRDAIAANPFNLCA